MTRKGPRPAHLRPSGDSYTSAMFAVGEIQIPRMHASSLTARRGGPCPPDQKSPSLLFAGAEREEWVDVGHQRAALSASPLSASEVSIHRGPMQFGSNVDTGAAHEVSEGSSTCAHRVTLMRSEIAVPTVQLRFGLACTRSPCPLSAILIHSCMHQRIHVAYHRLRRICIYVQECRATPRLRRLNRQGNPKQSNNEQ